MVYKGWLRPPRSCRSPRISPRVRLPRGLSASPGPLAWRPAGVVWLGAPPLCLAWAPPRAFALCAFPSARFARLPSLSFPHFLRACPFVPVAETRAGRPCAGPLPSRRPWLCRPPLVARSARVLRVGGVSLPPPFFFVPLSRVACGSPSSVCLPLACRVVVSSPSSPFVSAETSLRPPPLWSLRVYACGFSSPCPLCPPLARRLGVCPFLRPVCRYRRPALSSLSLTVALVVLCIYRATVKLQLQLCLFNHVLLFVVSVCVCQSPC